MKTESDSSIDSPRSTKSTRGSTYTRSHDSPISSIFFRDKKSSSSPVGLERKEYNKEYNKKKPNIFSYVTFEPLKKASSGEAAEIDAKFKKKYSKSYVVYPSSKEEKKENKKQRKKQREDYEIERQINK